MRGESPGGQRLAASCSDSAAIAGVQKKIPAAYLCHSFCDSCSVQRRSHDVHYDAKGEHLGHTCISYAKLFGHMGRKRCSLSLYPTAWSGALHFLTRPRSSFTHVCHRLLTIRKPSQGVQGTSRSMFGGGRARILPCAMPFPNAAKHQ